MKALTGFFLLTNREELHPVVFVAQVHKRFVFIHPFKDGNGRIARLIMNTALIQAGYLLAVIPPILRHEYIQLLKKAHQMIIPLNKVVKGRNTAVLIPNGFQIVVSDGTVEKFCSNNRNKWIKTINGVITITY